MGCGTGAGTFVLAERFNSPIYGLDLSQAYVAQLEQTARENGAENVRGVVANMDEPPLPEHSFDLIWCDCSIYIAGFAQALEGWKRFLKPGGLIVASDVVWRTAAPSPACQEFWKIEYPDMSTVQARSRLAESLGYTVEAAPPLPRFCWWESFYQPLERRMDELEEPDGLSGPMKKVIESTRREVQVFREYEAEYGAAFFVMRTIG
jgi:ubiquinone/menaquinone biosynthesis C-methylase UbiE